MRTKNICREEENKERVTSLDASAECVLAAVGNVQEAVLILEVVVDLAHGRRGLRDGLVDEQEDGLLRRQLNALADDPHELRY